MALGAILGAGASLAGSLFNFGSTQSTNKANQELAAQQNEYNRQYQDREFQYNTAASNREYQRNLEMWNLQNEYNSPAAQRQRYIDAGLNPNLIYGTGTASAGNASSVPQYTAARYKAPSAERANLTAPQLSFDPYQAVQFGQALAIQKAQANQLTAQTQYTEQQTKNAATDNLLKSAQTLGIHLDNRQKHALFDLNVEQARENIRKTSATTANLQYEAANIRQRYVHNEYQIDKLVQEIRHLKQDYDVNAFKAKLLKLGITDRDNAITRFASRLLLANEEEINSIINTLKR